MCGIVGRITSQGGRTLAPALDAMRHRGPDAGAELELAVGGRHVRLGHRRLSILDLTEAANQPFLSADGRFAIVFNGEIYNHAMLRQRLASRGEAFRTRSDTEVLLAAVAADWERALPQLNGMYAFAVLDRLRQRMLLARDRFGIKPLYYAHGEDGDLVFASEIRPLAIALGRPLEPDPALIPEFLLNGFLYEPETGYLGIRKVPPGMALEIDLTTQRVGLLPAAVDDGTPAAEGMALDALIDGQLQLEVEADVPVGVFFSGGIDSSVLAAAAPRSVQALFVDYGGEHPGEADHAAAVASALGLTMRTARHVVHEAGVDDIVADFRSVAEGTEEPISDYTFVATRLISRQARESGFKVMLSGMGGDELFAGYPRHRAAMRWPVLHRLRQPLAVATRALRRLPAWSKRADRLAGFAAAHDFVEAYTSLVGYFSASEVAALTGRGADVERSFERLRHIVAPAKGQSLLRQAMRLDRHGFLSHNLTVTDRASMAESVEVRVPLLAPALDDLSARLADREMLHGAVGKQPLRRYLARHLPQALIDRPKVGFNPPLDARIGRLGAGRCADLLLAGPLAGVLDASAVRRWIDEHFTGQRNHTYRLWQLAYLNLWLQAARQPL